MRRTRQTVDELVALLSPIAVSWRDEHAETVLRLIETIPVIRSYDRHVLRKLLDSDFDAGLTVIRLALDLSKDELQERLRSGASGRTRGRASYRKEPEEFLEALEGLGAVEAIETVVKTPVSWKTVLEERLKAGRGSAIKGQKRGRFLEDFTERIVKGVFGSAYDARCRFRGATGASTEKADFAVPSKNDPRILIEVKAYGATGSKQTDILGDIRRIVDEKRHDTDLLLVTDGVTWKARLSDLRKLVEFQNRGSIARIYTQAMANELGMDLEGLKRDHSL